MRQRWKYRNLRHWNDTNTKIIPLVQDLGIVYSSTHSEDVRPLLKDVFEKLQNETTMEIWKLVTLE